AAVSGLLRHNTSITACSASLIRSAGASSLAAIALSACAYTCNRSDYGCKHEASMNVVCLVRQKCLPHPSDTGGRPMGALMTQVMDIGRIRNLSDCHKIEDFRALARRKLPFPVFHYIDGAAD